MENGTPWVTDVPTRFKGRVPLCGLKSRQMPLCSKVVSHIVCIYGLALRAKVLQAGKFSLMFGKLHV